MSAITTHRNKVVDRLTAAVRSDNVSIDQTLGPHIVVEDQDQVIIIDVCCPFDNREEALDEAVAQKELKYEHLKAHFESLNKSCSVFGFAIGALARGILPMNAFFSLSICHHVTRTCSENFAVPT